jgi:hypothetical protein
VVGNLKYRSGSIGSWNLSEIPPIDPVRPIQKETQKETQKQHLAEQNSRTGSKKKPNRCEIFCPLCLLEPNSRRINRNLPGKNTKTVVPGPNRCGICPLTPLRWSRYTDILEMEQEDEVPPFTLAGMMPKPWPKLPEEQKPSPFAGMEPRPQSHWDHETRMQMAVAAQQEDKDREHGLVRGNQKL